MAKFYWWGLLLLLLLPVSATSLPLSCTLISGTLIKLPHKPLYHFRKASRLPSGSYPLSQTIFYIRTANGEVYQIIVTNLFYVYLTMGQAAINRDVGILDDWRRRFPLGSSVDACGRPQLRKDRHSLEWVHPSGCDQLPFDGFLRINGATVTGPAKYCFNCACYRR